jgi:chaperonin GroES
MAKGEMGVRPFMIVFLSDEWPKMIKRLADLFIPDTAKEKPQKGEIIATGKGRLTEDGKTLPLEVKAGDKVLFSKYAGTELKLDGEEFLMMREEDVLGVFN